MAELFLAQSPEFEHPVVIKRVLPHLNSQTEFLKMFLNEARIAAQLHHPGIVRIFDLGEASGQFYIAMEYIDGVNLDTLSKAAGGRLEPVIAAKVGAELCEALYYANRVTDLNGQPLNVVHRDVTPANVMITRQGVVKLVDFGVAKAEAQLEHTRPGVVKGKFRYMSPEQFELNEVDGRSDLFSVGVLLYEITTGKRVFERKQLVDIAYAVIGWHPPPPHELVPDFPKRLSEVITVALRKDRAQRYSDGREMKRALDAVLAQISLKPMGAQELADYVSKLTRQIPGRTPPPMPIGGGKSAKSKPPAATDGHDLEVTIDIDDVGAADKVARVAQAQSPSSLPSPPDRLAATMNGRQNIELAEYDPKVAQLEEDQLATRPIRKKYLEKQSMSSSSASIRLPGDNYAGKTTLKHGRQKSSGWRWYYLVPLVCAALAIGWLGLRNQVDFSKWKSHFSLKRP